MSTRVCRRAASRHSKSTQKHPIRRVSGLFDVLVVQIAQVLEEVGPFAGRHLDTGEDAPVIGAMIAVMEQADVPARADRPQELEQRPGALGELEAVQQLVLESVRVAA